MTRPMAADGNRPMGPAQPDPQHGADKQAQAHQNALGIVVKQAIGNALVPHQEEIEEGGESHRPPGADVIDIEHPQFVGLVDHENQQRQGKAQRR